MTRRNQIWLIISLMAALLAMVLLAAGLPQLELHPGTLFEPETMGQLWALLAQFSALRNWFLVLTLLGIMVVIVLSFTTKSRPLSPPPEARNVTFGTLLRVFLIAVTLLLLGRRFQEGQFDLDLPSVEDLRPEFPDAPVEIVSGDVPEWFAFVFSLGLIVVLGVIAWIIWRRRRRPIEPLGLLVHEAQVALNELHVGGDYQDVILRCYFEMSKVLSEQRGIRRKQGMTPREFEQRLIELRLPREPVRQLTHLFELVRYGAKDLGEQEQSQARACLVAIVQAGGEES